MKSLFSPNHHDAIVARISRLTPKHRPQWGSMTAPQVLCHLMAVIRLSLLPECPRAPHGPMARAPFNWLVICLLPWPKGKAESPPEFMDFELVSWEQDRDTLLDLVAQFHARRPTDAWPQSIAFGRISGRTWGVLQYKHLDHHLRQFGV